MRISRHPQNLCVLLWCLPLLLILSSCAFMELKKDIEEYSKVVTIKGRVIDEAGDNIPVVVALLAVDEPARPKLVSYQEMERAGQFFFKVQPGSYRIFAFENHNRDKKYRVEDRTGRSGPIDARKPGSVIELLVKIPLKVDSLLVNRIQEIRTGLEKNIPPYIRYIGTVIDLSDPAFEAKNVKMGLWEPYRFTKEIPMGIFFLQDYHADKIPVLFVHGISGSPVNFKEIIAAIDTDHFQPWVFYYPSGFRLELIAHYLDLVLDTLCYRYQFKRIALVAHSMGGLISRAFINRERENVRSYSINPFISISTPWAGHAAARLGVEYAPAVVPAWNDLAPGSLFLQKLFYKKLPQNMRYCLLFSFKGHSRFADGNSDGVVSIASELRPEAQEEADLMRGFNETHMGILRDAGVSEFINRELQTMAKGCKK